MFVSKTVDKILVNTYFWKICLKLFCSKKKMYFLAMNQMKFLANDAKQTAYVMLLSNEKMIKLAILVERYTE